MPPFVSLIGRRFGRLVVVERGPSRGGRTRWRCRCECGTKVTLRQSDLKSRQSCGCLHEQRRLVAITTHGMTNSPEYRAWRSAKRRCFVPSEPQYHNYGGRGISMCQAWRESFEAFLRDVGRRPSSQHSLDRYPNNNGHYEPGNVRWAISQDQARNRRNTIRFWGINNESLSLQDLSHALALDTLLLKRLFIRSGVLHG